MLRLRQPVANPTGAHNCVVAYTPLWWTGEEASWCLLQPKYARGNSTAVAASSQAVHRTAEAVLTSLRYSHSANSTTSLMSCTFDLWWQLYSSCLKLPHVAAVIRPREVPPASNLTMLLPRKLFRTEVDQQSWSRRNPARVLQGDARSARFAAALICAKEAPSCSVGEWGG